MYASTVRYHPCVCAYIYFYPFTSFKIIAIMAISASPVDTCTFPTSHTSRLLSKPQKETKTCYHHEAGFLCKLIFFL